jgi:HK97 family phage major capsid protein
MNLNELRQERAKLLTNQRAYLDMHTDFTAEDSAAVAAMDADLDRMESRITAEERNEARMATLATSAGESVTPEVATGNVLDSAEYSAALWNYVRTGEIHNAMSVGVTTAGGYTVPTTYEQRLIEAKENVNPIRQLATVRTTANPGKVPALNTRPVFALIAENGAFPVTEPVYGQKGYDAYKFGGTILVAEELLQDSMFDIESHIADLYGKAAAVVENGYFTTGTAVAQPQGFVTGSEMGKTIASLSAITADELMDLQGSLKAGYDPDACWCLRKSVWTLIRKLKDGQGRYVLDPSLRAGDVDTLLGKTAHKLEDMPAMGANAKPITYGDMSYFNILDRAGVSIQRLNELYAGNGQVGFRCWFRTDSTLEVAEAVKHILCPAV